MVLAATKTPKRTLIERSMPDIESVVEQLLINDWVEVCTEPDATDNAAATVVNPGAIARAGQSRYNSHGLGRTLRIRMKYDRGISVPVSPVVQPFGFDGNGAPVRLLDGNGDHELTLTVDTTNDVDDGTWKYTTPVEVDMAGCRDFIVAVKTAFAATGTVNTSTLQVQLSNRPVSAPIEANVNAGSLATAANQTTGNASLALLDDAVSSTALRTVGMGDVLDVTLSCDTGAIIDGDVLADTQEIANAVRIAAGLGYIQSIQLLDEDDQGQPIDLYFFNANQSLGTENSAPSISDANARTYIGRVQILAGDYYDIGGCKVATKTSVGLMFKAAAAQTSIWVAAVVRGGGTYTASGVRLKIGVMWD